MICMVCSMHFARPVSMVYFVHSICFRTSPAEFIVPVDKYMESVKIKYATGMRFKMRFEADDAPEQRYDFETFPFLNDLDLNFHLQNERKKLSVVEGGWGGINMSFQHLWPGSLAL